MSRARPADVLEAAGHELLPVEVIGPVTGRAQPFLGEVEHGRHLGRPGQRRALGEDARALFQAEGMYRDVLRRQGEHLFERGAEALGIVPRQARDQVHVHREAADRAHLFQRGEDIRGRVPPADGLEHRVGHGLRVDAHAVHPVRAQDAQLLLRDRVGPSGLHRELAQRGELEAFLQLFTDALELPRGERRGRAAAEIQRHRPQAERPALLPRRLDLLFQRVEEGRDELHALFHRLADEAAVGAARRAEGHAEIEADVLFLQRGLGRERMARGVEAQGRAARRNVVVFGEAPQRLVLAETASEQRREQLARPHAGQRAPGGLFVPCGERGAVHRVLDEPLLGPLASERIRRVGVVHPREAAEHAAPMQDAARRGHLRGAMKTDLHPLARRGAPGVLRAFLRKERQKHLFDRVSIFMPRTVQLHILSPLPPPAKTTVGKGAGNDTVLLYQTVRKKTTVKIIEKSRDSGEKTLKKSFIFRKKHWKFF